MHFPSTISLTVTNACNLRCKMCGQWSEEGYVRNNRDRLKDQMERTDWLRVVDEVAAEGIGAVLIRGGEPFLFPHIIELLEYLSSKGIFVPIDTNGTQLERYAADIVRIGNIHLTISIDGPEDVHDEVRGVKGCFAKIRAGLARLREAEQQTGRQISVSANFTISPYSLRGLGQLPDVARSLGLKTVCIVPYYYVPDTVGRQYEQEMRQQLGCPAFSWRGFHHDSAGIDFGEFQRQYRQFLASLDGIHSYPYMPLSEDQYRTWFSDPVAPVGPQHCTNVERLLDIQPNGDANFCVDFPDYCIGNVRQSTIKAIWNSERATRFRACRRQRALSVCHRCGAKHMSEISG